MVRLDMTLVFYACELTTNLYSLEAYSFDEWDDFDVVIMNAGWQHNGYFSRDLCVDMCIVIDGYQTLGYIYKGMYVCMCQRPREDLWCP